MHSEKIYTIVGFIIPIVLWLVWFALHNSGIFEKEADPAPKLGPVSPKAELLPSSTEPRTLDDRTD
jgi:hypothetical protein